jgi:hypothetical protein
MKLRLIVVNSGRNAKLFRKFFLLLSAPTLSVQ